MFRHALVLVVAVAVALGMAHQLVTMANTPATDQGVSRPAPEAVQNAAGTEPSAVARASAPSTSVAPALAGDLTPGDAQVARSPDGHYWADAQVDGRNVRFLIDTGASFVALTRGDAEQLGLNPSSLVYDAPVTTANGATHAARVQLDYVAVAGARVEQVPAMVIADGLSTSLLGMSYLNRLSGFQATPTSLILRP